MKGERGGGGRGMVVGEGGAHLNCVSCCKYRFLANIHIGNPNRLKVEKLEVCFAVDIFGLDIKCCLNLYLVLWE